MIPKIRHIYNALIYNDLFGVSKLAQRSQYTW